MDIFLSAAGSLVQPFVDSVYNRVEQFIESRIMLAKEAEEELHHLRHTLPHIQDVVEHVAGTQSKNVAVRSWLGDLKDVMYDVEDLLDQTDADIALGKAVGVSIAQEIKKINDRLDRIYKQRRRYRIFKISESSHQSVSSMIVKNRDTTSVPDADFPTIGRDDDRDEIINMLVNARSGSGNLSVLPIVGMGGLGKTSLARLVFNHEKVDAFFRLKMWVCVGMYYHGFDLKQITIDIIDTMRGRNESRERCYKSMSLESLQNNLSSRIAEKQPFLLVLDDAWNENYRSWNELLKPLRALGQDSWLIVTTRKMGVANTIRGQQPEPKILTGLDDGSISEDLLDSWFKNLICLRVLHLHNSTITSLPNSIGNLKLLRYLHLNLPGLKELPETVCNLCNLQVLRLVGILQYELPSSLTKLVNLKYLDAVVYPPVRGNYGS